MQLGDTTAALGTALTSGSAAESMIIKAETNTSMAVYGVGMVFVVDENDDFALVDLRICP